MDPDTNVEEMKRLVEKLLSTAPSEYESTDVYRLAELLSALHGWIARGGSVPKGWKGDFNSVWSFYRSFLRAWDVDDGEDPDGNLPDYWEVHDAWKMAYQAKGHLV